MFKNKSAILMGFASSLLAAQAGALVQPYSGYNSGSLPSCDDCYSDAESLGFNADFFGETYSSAYVGNNGYITFEGGQSTYTPTGLTSSYTGNPIIAPFYADVDTRGVGTVTYGNGTYNGAQAFGVTWTNVGYYAGATDKTNTFQMLLVNRSNIGAGDFDIIFNYAQIQWEAGSASGGYDGLGGTSAAVGYANGTGAAGTYFQLAGSLVPGSFIDSGTSPLINGTNDGTPGQYLFEVRNGQVIAPPVPLPASAWLMLGGLGILGGFARKKKRAA